MYEYELKFCVERLAPIEQKVKKLGGVFVKTRAEKNFFYLFRNWLLRLRTSPSEITLKGPVKHGAVRSGLELNLPVPRFLLPLLRLPFIFAWRYDKTRTTYKLEGVKVELDKLNFGTFVEIEGAPDKIKKVQKLLGLKTPEQRTYSMMVMEQ